MGSTPGQDRNPDGNLGTGTQTPWWRFSLSRVRLFATLWTVARQASLSMGFSRQEYWNGLPLPSPGDLSNPGIEPGSPALQADSLLTELRGKPGVPLK